MKKILVVEDNQSNRYLIRVILENRGYEIIEAATGREGIERAIKEKPDLILMDIQLPDITGLEAIKEIRASEIDGDIPIIAITSYAMTGDKERTLNGGCTGYIEKPIDPDTFTAEIEKYLK